MKINKKRLTDARSLNMALWATLGVRVARNVYDGFKRRKKF